MFGGGGSGYVVIAIEIKLQKQLTFHYCLLRSIFVCLCAHREQFVDTDFLRPQVSEELTQVFKLGGRHFLPAESFYLSAPSSVVPLCSPA